jgi:hypothetical protein
MYSLEEDLLWHHFPAKPAMDGKGNHSIEGIFDGSRSKRSRLCCVAEGQWKMAD